MENMSRNQKSNEKRFEKLVSTKMESSAPTVKRKLFFGSQSNKSSHDQQPKAKRQRKWEKAVKKYKNCFAPSRKLILPSEKVELAKKTTSKTNNHQIKNKLPNQISSSGLNLSESCNDEVQLVESSSTKRWNNKFTSSKEVSQRIMEEPSKKIKQELLDEQMKKNDHLNISSRSEEFDNLNLSEESSDDENQIAKSLEVQRPKIKRVSPTKEKSSAVTKEGVEHKKERSSKILSIREQPQKIESNSIDSSKGQAQIVKSPPAQQERTNRGSLTKGESSAVMKEAVESENKRSKCNKTVKEVVHNGPSTSKKLDSEPIEKQAAQEKPEKTDNILQNQIVDQIGLLSEISNDENQFVKQLNTNSITAEGCNRLKFQKWIDDWEELREKILQEMEKIQFESSIVCDAQRFETCDDVTNYWLKKVSKSEKGDKDEVFRKRVPNMKTKKTEDNRLESYFDWRLNRDKVDVPLTPGKWYSNNRIDETKLDKGCTGIIEADLYLSSSEEESDDEKYAAPPLTPGKHM